MHKVSNKLFVLLSLALALIIGLPAQAADVDFSEAINKAGRQRMLSQRIVKAYAQVVLDIQYDESEKQLKDAVKLFDAQLSDLSLLSPNNTVSQSLGLVQLLWKPFKALALEPATREGAVKLIEMSDPLLTAAHQVVVDLQKEVGSEAARVVNISGRQRMLSQRIAKDYMLLSMGVHSSAMAKELEQSRQEFESALTSLKSSSLNTQQIKQSLSEVERQWSVFKKSFKLSNSGKFVPLLVAMASEQVLKQMNDITSFYAQKDRS